MKNSYEPHVKRGWLKNGNSPGDLSKAPRCGAKAKRTQKPCRSPALKNRLRCRLHGGKSTGPKTLEGLNRSKTSNLKSGDHSTEAKADRRNFSQILNNVRSTLKQIKEVL